MLGTSRKLQRGTRWLVLSALALTPLLARADLPLSTVRAMLSGQPSSIEDAFALADEFRTGQGQGVWQSDCLAKYFYKLGLDAVNAAGVAATEPALRDAQSRLDALMDKHTTCQVYLTGVTDPGVPLNALVRINGTIPQVSPNPAPVAPPARPSSQSAGGIPVPPQSEAPPPLRSPVNSGLPIDKVIRQREGPTAPPPVVIRSSPQQCTAKWSLYGQMQEFMRDYADLSKFVYASDLSIQRAEDAIADLDQRIDKAAPDVRPYLKHQRAQSEAGLGDLRNLQQEKDQVMAQRGYQSRVDLMDAFHAAEGSGRKTLDDADFYAEVYERGGLYVVVFRGTSLPVGWLSDFKQILNVENAKGKVANGMFDEHLDLEQAQRLYRYADQLVAFLIKKRGIAPSSIVTTGHSLGGGLAVYAHLRNDTRLALVFNPAELSSNHDALVAKSKARDRVVNYISYVPGIEAADLVQQGTKVAKELPKIPLIDMPDGYRYGDNFFLPVPVGASTWHLARYSALYGGAAATNLRGTAAAVGVAAGSAATSDERVATAVVRGRATLAAGTAWNVFRHPVRSAALAGIGATVSYRKVAPLENLAWGLYTLHIMAPLATSAEGLYVDPRDVVCAGPPTPAFVQSQIDTRDRVGAFLRLAARIGSAQ